MKFVAPLSLNIQDNIGTIEVLQLFLLLYGYIIITIVCIYYMCVYYIRLDSCVCDCELTGVTSHGGVTRTLRHLMRWYGNRSAFTRWALL